MGKRIDLTGQRFGKLVVISYNDEISKQKKGRQSYWNCECDCGNKVIIRGDCLKGGATASCGCYQKEKMREQQQEKKEDLTGQRFGRLVVIGLNEEITKQKKGTYWNCKCDCGNKKAVRSGHLKSGATTSCGCYHREKASDIMRDVIKKQWGSEEFKQIYRGNIGESHPNYKGGITPISTYLRNLNEQWFNNCKQQANYTCELTGKVGGKLHAHHLKAFSTIVLEAHELHNIQVKPQVKDYTEEELYMLEEYVASWHKDSSNAVVLCEEAHDLFHRAKNKGGYGNRNNTPEQYEEFKQRYLNGEFEGLI